MMDNIKSTKDIRLYPLVIESLEKGVLTYEGLVFYLNYISLDIVGLIKSGSEASRARYNDLSANPHLNPQVHLKLAKAILPKTLSNIVVPRTYFPATILKSLDQESIDILYSNQNLENAVQSCKHYTVLIKTILRVLIGSDLEPNQVKDLVLCSFKYYNLFHFEKAHGASQIVIESLKKMETAVRYAISDEITLFITVLRKLGKELFLNYLH